MTPARRAQRALFASENPGRRAGQTGVRSRSSEGEDQHGVYARRLPAARSIFRTIINDDGHFQGLEVVR